MSRALLLLGKLFTGIGKSGTSVSSVRLHGIAGGCVLQIEIPNGPCKPLLETLRTSIWQPSDSAFASTLGTQCKFDPTTEVPPVDCRSITISLLPDAVPTLPDLKRTALGTALGMPSLLTKGLPIDKIDIYFGANAIPVVLNRPNAQLWHFQSSRVATRDLDRFEVEFNYLSSGHFRKISVSADSYLSSELASTSRRLKFRPQQGITVFTLEDVGEAEKPFGNEPVLGSKVNSLFEVALKLHQNRQLSRINSRLSECSSRPHVKAGGALIGVEPRNEVETLILLERLTSRGFLPCGIKLEVVEYSPRDIDSICRYARSSGAPLTTVSVEFEYCLANFFQHGHDPRQIQLIICYRGMKFPYDHEGHTYKLLETPGSIPRLVCEAEGVSVDCLILERIVSRSL